jgi:hypothetical protein
MWGLGRTDDPRQGYAAPDGTEAVQQYQCAPGCVVAALERQAGESVSTASGHRGRSQIWGSCDGTEMPRNGYDDSGSVSRFFATMDWSLDVAEQLAQAAPAYYEPKASRAERDAGLEGMPLYSAADLTGRIPGRAGLQFPSRPHANGGNPYAGISGGSRHNSHPTVKPLTLLKWLATLLLPPAAYAPRRILCPFSGSGSEVIGAILAGWEHVTGIEQDPAYVQLARRRLAYWTGYRAPDPDPGTDPAPVASDGPAGQLALF